jgi:hypothetical protein
MVREKTPKKNSATPASVQDEMDRSVDRHVERWKKKLYVVRLGGPAGVAVQRLGDLGSSKQKRKK